jgi:hypothetical protein
MDLCGGDRFGAGAGGCPVVVQPVAAVNTRQSRTADFQVCCIAGFQTRRPSVSPMCPRTITPSRFGNRRYSRLGNLRYAGRLPARTADFQVCRIAGFQTRRPSVSPMCPRTITPSRFGNRRYSRLGNLRYAGRLPARTADFQVCCVAGFQTRRSSVSPMCPRTITPSRFGNRRYSRLGNLRHG